MPVGLKCYRVWFSYLDDVRMRHALLTNAPDPDTAVDQIVQQVLRAENEHIIVHGIEETR